MEIDISPATANRILKRAGAPWIKGARIRDIEPAEPIIRHEYKEPGGHIHLEIERNPLPISTRPQVLRSAQRT